MGTRLGWRQLLGSFGTSGQVLLSNGSSDPAFGDLMPVITAATSGTATVALLAGRQNLCDITTTGNITVNVTGSGRAKLLLRLTLGGAHQPAVQYNGNAGNVRWKDRNAPSWSLVSGYTYMIEAYTDGTYLDVTNWYLYYGLWTPASLGSSLMAWFDASDTATITQSSSRISQWSDKSGNGRHLTQANSVNQPSLVSGQVSFTKSSQTQLTSSASFTPAFVYMVVNPSANGLFALFGNNNNGWGMGMGTSGGAEVSGTSALIFYPGVRWIAGATLSGTRIITAGVATATAPTLALDGGTDTSYSGTAYNATTGGFLVGGNSGLGSENRYFTGSIAEIVCVNAATDRTKVEGYLAWKWGLTANLPGGHAFKNAAP